jgi:hypothetical protein
MKIQILDQGTDILFHVSMVNDAEQAILLASFFTEDAAGVFTKRFARSTLMFAHDLALMAENFAAYLREQQDHEQRRARCAQALDWLCRTHAEHAIDWWLTGSAALFVRGLDLIPHDIDVMTYKSEIPRIHAAINQQIVEPFHHVSGWVVKGFGVINQNYRIDYAFEAEEWVDTNGPVDFGPMAERDREVVVWNGHTILVPKLHYHLLPNRVRQRQGVVAQIERLLGLEASI